MDIEVPFLYEKKKKEKYIPLTLNTWTEVGYKTKAFMSYSVQSRASWIVIWLLLLPASNNIALGAIAGVIFTIA